MHVTSGQHALKFAIVASNFWCLIYLLGPLNNNNEQKILDSNSYVTGTGKSSFSLLTPETWGHLLLQHNLACHE
jgi:hypothetical protein